MNERRPFILILFLLVCVLASGSTASAQTTAFTYQGRLTDAGNPASGNFDFEFRLFDAENGGGQIGPPVPRNMVTVASGSFAVPI